MAKPIVPSRVALSTGLNLTTASTALTTEIAYLGHTLTTAQLNSSGTLTASSAFPASPGTPIQITAAHPARKALIISAASDGVGGFYGSDVNVTPATGHFVFPGTQLSITGYLGAIYAVAEVGTQPQKFWFQET